MGSANGQSLAPTCDPILDALGKGEEQQALRGVVIALTAVRLAIMHQASSHHGQSCGQQVGRVAARVDQLAVCLAVTGEEGAEAEGGQQVAKLGATVPFWMLFFEGGRLEVKTIPSNFKKWYHPDIHRYTTC